MICDRERSGIGTTLQPSIGNMKNEMAIARVCVYVAVYVYAQLKLTKHWGEMARREKLVESGDLG